MKTFKRITVDPNQRRPPVGLRIPVATIVGMVSEGMAEAEILVTNPDLEVEDICEALRYALRPSASGNFLLLMVL